jgi:hypothetical protein
MSDHPPPVTEPTAEELAEWCHATAAWQDVFLSLANPALQLRVRQKLQQCAVALSRLHFIEEGEPIGLAHRLATTYSRLQQMEARLAETLKERAEKAERERDEFARQRDRLWNSTEAAESSLREHAAAIVALRAFLEGYGKHRAGCEILLHQQGLYGYKCTCGFAEILATSPSALASRLSAEREAERAVVRAAQRWWKEAWGQSTSATINASRRRTGYESQLDADEAALIDALAALPASPSEDA